MTHTKTPWTPGPLTVRITERRPFRIETVDASGNVVFSTELPCYSSDSPTADAAYRCLHVYGAERETHHAMNVNALADETIRAAAPDLYEALKLLLEDVQGYEAWQRPCHAVDVARAALARATAP